MNKLRIDTEPTVRFGLKKTLQSLELLPPPSPSTTTIVNDHQQLLLTASQLPTQEIMSTVAINIFLNVH